MFTFSRLFSEAWTCAMTMKDIQARFECTGIYHLNRDAIVPLTKCVTNTLAQCTGLKVYCYIALHNNTGLPLHKKLYSQKKTNQDFKKDFKKVLILLLTTNYNQWKKINHLMHSLIKNMIWVSNCPQWHICWWCHHLYVFSISILPTRYSILILPTIHSSIFSIFVPAFDPHFQSCAFTTSTETSMYPFICLPPEQFSHSAVLQKSSIFWKILEEERSLLFCKVPVIPYHEKVWESLNKHWECSDNWRKREKEIWRNEKEERKE